MTTLSPDVNIHGQDTETFQDSPVLRFETDNATEYLKRLEDAEALELLPVMIVLGLMSLVGNVGNGVALYVYYTRFTPSSTRTYIIAMSAFDLLFCSLSLPAEILDLRFPLTYIALWLCRLYRFITVCLTLFSAMILVAVALDRRRKICFPFRPQLTSRQVSLTVVGCIVAAMVLGFPFGVLNGHHSVKTDIEGVVGSACSVDDAFIETSFPIIYNGILLLIFLACAICMAVSYVQIARKVIAHKRKSVAGRGTSVIGLALLMGKHSPRETIDTHGSSSHFDGSSACDAKHHHRENVPEPPAQIVDNSKLDDDVFATDTDPKTPVSETDVAAAAKNANPESKRKPPASSKKSQKIPKSKSMKKREEEFEMAVKTLVHAVSEDMLLSSELFQKRAASHSLSRTRSASVSEASPSLYKKIIPETTSQIGVTASSENNNEVKAKVEDDSPLTSLENEATKASELSEDGDEMGTGEKEKGTSSKLKQKSETKRIQRSASLKSTGENKGTETDSSTSIKKNGESKNEEIKRNTSLKSSFISNNDTKADNDQAKHASISESRSDRLRSFLYNTLTRKKPRDQSTLDDVAVTSSLRRRHWGKTIPSRTTWMMFILTAIFVISYLPYLTLAGVRAAHHGIETGLDGWKLNLYTLALKSYFINSIINPFVYSFCSARFRHQCRHLFRRRPKMSISD